jgi:hypothetical protein
MDEERQQLTGYTRNTISLRACEVCPTSTLTIKVKLSLCLLKHYAMKTYGGADTQHQLHATADLPPIIHWTRNWVDLKTSFNAVLDTA